MGMKYRIHCVDCSTDCWRIGSTEVEFSASRAFVLKRPDEAEQKLIKWAAFLVEHSGHRLRFVDELLRETNPAKITGKYVLGYEVKRE